MIQVFDTKTNKLIPLNELAIVSGTKIHKPVIPKEFRDKTLIQKPKTFVTPKEKKQKRVHQFEKLPSIAIAISVHPAYIKYLQNAISAVENQINIKDVKIEKWISFDNCTEQSISFLPSDWKIYKGSHNSPGPGRDHIIKNTECSWITWLDADDWISSKLIRSYYDEALKSEFKIGFIYPDFNICNDEGTKISSREFPVFDYDKLRQFNFVPTPSLWRVDALRLIDSWCDGVPILDDWTASMKLSRSGWKGKHLESKDRINVRKHGNNASSDHNKMIEKTWDARSLAIITLFSGKKELLPQWEEWIRSAKLPKETTVIAGNNSSDDEFEELLLGSLSRISSNGYSTVYKKIKNPMTEVKGPRAVYSRVPALYNQIMPLAVQCGDLVLMLEDDIKPPLDGVYNLAAAMKPLGKHRIGAVAGIYPARGGNGRLVSLSSKPDIWTGNVMIEQLQTNGIHPIGMVPGGFTLFAQEALKHALPFRFSWDTSGNPTGWDGNCSRALRDYNWEIYYHGGVRCEHHTQDRDGTKIRVLKFPEVKKEGCGSIEEHWNLVNTFMKQRATGIMKDLFDVHWKKIESNPHFTSCQKNARRKPLVEQWKNSMKVSLIIPAREEPEEELNKTIKSFREAGVNEIIVIDDCSRVHPVNNNCPADILIRNDVALGVSGSRNKGLSLATGDVIMFSDSHCLVDEGSLRDWCFQALSSDKMMCAVCASYDNPQRKYYGYELVWRDWFFEGHANTIQTEYPTGLYGSVYCAHRSVWQRIGGWFPTRQWGANEQALTLVCQLADIKVNVDPDFVCLHKFRNDKKFPYPVEGSISKANHPWLFWTIFGEKLFDEIFLPAAKKNLSQTSIDQVYKWIEEDGKMIREKYESLRKVSPEDIMVRIGFKKGN